MTDFAFICESDSINSSGIPTKPYGKGDGLGVGVSSGVGVISGVTVGSTVASGLGVGSVAGVGVSVISGVGVASGVGSGVAVSTTGVTVGDSVAASPSPSASEAGIIVKSIAKIAISEMTRFQDLFDQCQPIVNPPLFLGIFAVVFYGSYRFGNPSSSW
jgi:hypothetical protein